MIKLTRPACPNPTALQTDYSTPVNKDALRSASFGKCMYCEGKVLPTYYGEIEHIKPKSLFEELEYEWSNLGYACAVCNRTKGAKYNAEERILNPYTEEPKDHLIPLGAVMQPRNNSHKGIRTIQRETGVDLNRAGLIESRQEYIDRIEKTISICLMIENEDVKIAALDSMVSESAEDKEYSLCIKTLLRSKGILP